MSADVCILVEGTYPFVTGGVSAWIHSLISNLAEFTFTVVHIGAVRDADRRPKYELPPNVVGFTEVFVHEPSPQGEDLQKMSPSKVDWEDLAKLHEAFAHGDPAASIDVLHREARRWPNQAAASRLFHSKESWDFLLESYRLRAPQSSFIDYFWTYRVTHMSLFAILNASLPKAHLYHATSTGYAGLAGALAKVRTGVPLLITEHGIYTREREIEIAQANWIHSDHPTSPRLDAQPGVFRAWWTQMFKFMSQFSYDCSDEIISLTRVNQRFQLQDGADPDRMQVIPNGVSVERFGNVRLLERADPERFVVGLVGRVVPIKDVKTFLQAIKIARDVIPALVAYVVGPLDEDASYYDECCEMARFLGIADVVQFTGRADVLDYYRHIDVLVLTSLSEGQPLVILEANCAGVPVVATDVGACRELLEGASRDDQELGPSGLLTSSASPHETAEALVRLWRDEPLRQRLARAGQERVRRFYREESVYEAYRGLYVNGLRGAEAEVA